MRTSLAKAENIKQDNSSQIAWMRIKSRPGLCPKNMAGTRISILSIMMQCPKQNQSQVHAHSAKKPDLPASKQEVHILAFRVLKRFLIPLSSTVRLDWCLTFVSEVKDDTIKSAGLSRPKENVEDAAEFAGSHASKWEPSLVLPSSSPFSRPTCPLSSPQEKIKWTNSVLHSCTDILAMGLKEPLSNMPHIKTHCRSVLT